MHHLYTLPTHAIAVSQRTVLAEGEDMRTCPNRARACDEKTA